FLGSLVLFFGIAAAASSQPAASEIDPNVVAAWKKANAQAGWFSLSETGPREVSKSKPADPALPAFRFLVFKAGGIPKLPPPAVPFALDLRAAGSSTTDARLKDLSGLKTLAALDLRFTPVTGAGLKSLSGLKSLGYLDLGHAKVSAGGMKAISGLAS